MTLPEAAAFLRLDEDQLKASVERSDLPARNIGGEWRLSRAAILAWLGAAVQDG
jgi:excisionase family DNA binding protein